MQWCGLTHTGFDAVLCKDFGDGIAVFLDDVGQDDILVGRKTELDIRKSVRNLAQRGF